MPNQTIVTTTTDQTQSLGQQIGACLNDLPTRSDAFVIALHGELGAGKTTLTQGIAAGLGVTQPVTSPTYMLINEYPLQADRTFIHVDSYRLADAPGGSARNAALGIGLDEFLDDDRAILIIEWASYLADLLPADHLAITLSHDPQTADPKNADAREITLSANGPISQSILEQIAP